MDNLLSNENGANVHGAKGGNEKDPLAPFARLTQQMNAFAEKAGSVVAVETSAPLLELLESRRFRIDNPPPRPVPIFTISGQSCGTKGNLGTNHAQAKAGKTGLLRAKMATALDCAFGMGIPYLGICSDGEPGLILHFDTEQSRYDHWWGIQRVLNRIGAKAMPDELHSFCVTDLGIAQRRKLLFLKMAELRKRGPIKAVFLDGYADLIHDVNDVKETDPYVAELQAAAIEFDTFIDGAIHENPSGTESGKTRGHLGSQLQRKAETNLRLEKDKTTGIITVYSAPSRNCDILKVHGPRFVWCDQAKDFVDVPTAGEAKRGTKADDLKRQAAAVFFDAPQLSHAGVIEQLVKNERLATGGARHRFDAMRKAGILTQKSDGNWILER